jgi:hypothetical protein
MSTPSHLQRRFANGDRSGGGRNLTSPARQYAVNGERHSFALLRTIEEAAAQERVRDLVLGAFAEYGGNQQWRPIRSTGSPG